MRKPIPERSIGPFIIGMPDLRADPVTNLLETRRWLRGLLVDLDHAIEQRQTAASTAAIPAPEQAIKIAEVCARLGYKYTYLIRHWPKMGGFKDEARRVKFPVDVVKRLAKGKASLRS